MGRETKILLGLLGLLAGVFVGVLSMKLLVPRPPDGAGPDIHTDDEFVETQQVVEPPVLAPRAWDFAAAPPLVAEQPVAVAAPAEPSPAVAPSREPAVPATRASDDLLTPPPADFAAEPPRSRFAVQPASAIEPEVDDAAAVPPTVGGVELAPAPAAAASPPARDPFVARTAWDEPVAAVPGGAAASASVGTPVAAGSRHTVQAGDSWWSLAERAYGDGRFYRALFAWNRVLDPRVSLAPGTTLEVPPLPKLEAAWPKLLPPRGP